MARLIVVKGWLSAAGYAVLLLAASTGCGSEGRSQAAESASSSSSSSPSVSASSAADIGYRDCQADTAGDRLAAPFWIDNNHLDPSSGQDPTHSREEALHAYETDPATRGAADGTSRAVFFASYSTVGSSPGFTAEPVWVVVDYHVAGVGSLANTPDTTDVTSILDDANLNSLGVIASLPSRCE